MSVSSAWILFISHLSHSFEDSVAAPLQRGVERIVTGPGPEPWPGADCLMGNGHVGRAGPLLPLGWPKCMSSCSLAGFVRFAMAIGNRKIILADTSLFSGQQGRQPVPLTLTYSVFRFHFETPATLANNAQANNKFAQVLSQAFSRSSSRSSSGSRSSSRSGSTRGPHNCHVWLHVLSVRVPVPVRVRVRVWAACPSALRV